MKFVGFERNCFKSKDGNEVSGYNVFLARQVAVDSGKGMATERVYLSDSKIADGKLDLAKMLDREVELYYNKYGKVQRIVLIG